MLFLRTELWKLVSKLGAALLISWITKNFGQHLDPALREIKIQKTFFSILGFQVFF